MLESEPIKEDKIASSDQEATVNISETDKKRVKMGIILGAGLFFLLLIVLIVLVSTSELTPRPPPPPKPAKKNISSNPFVVIDNYVETPRKRIVTIFNNRTKIEAPNFTFPRATPIVRNTTENLEPDYIRVSYEQLDEHLLNVYYEDPTVDRWEVPDYGNDDDPYSDASDAITPKQFDPIISVFDRKFEWAFKGKTNEAIISTENCRLQFFDKYIEFEARVQSDYIYGMGERQESFALKNDNYSLWNRDVTYDYGQGDTERGMFSSHPFFLNRLKNKKDFIAVYMRNSNAMLFSLWHTHVNGTFINYKTIGGLIDLYLFHSADPDYLIKKYHSVIGRPYLPPLWAMGLQQARKGYDLNALKAVVAGYAKAEIPIDGVWADEELNDNHKTFTVDSTRFGGIKEFVQDLHDPQKKINMKFVALTDSYLKKEVGYKYYDEAIKDNCLIKSALHYDHPFEGRTLADTSVWLDYFQHSAVLVWATGLHDLHDLVNFDGVWISNSEPTHFCDGECSNYIVKDLNRKEKSIPNPHHNASEFDYIQYRPTLDYLERNTLPMAAYQCCDDSVNKQYNTHNLFGLQVANATFEGLSALFEDKRFLVVTRSTWPGSGKVSSHFLAENYGTWDSLVGSIPGMLNFNMFGIPHVGAPIGGYYGNVSPELLARWYELGCFSPLMLSYTNSNNGPKEAYAIPEIVPHIQRAVLERYSLLQWMYTQMFESFLWGGAVIHPIFFDFPEEEEVYKREIVDRTFMWGKTLYVIPALIPGQTRIRAYLPNWRWYDLRTREMVVDYKTEGGNGDYYYFDQPIGTITCLIKGGAIITYQRDVHTQKIMNVEDLKKIPALIIVAPDHLGRAQGSLIVDSDGIKPHPYTETYRHYSFTYMNQIFRVNKLNGFDFHDFHQIDYFWEVIILDIFGKNIIDFACMMDTDLYRKELVYEHTLGSNAIRIHDVRDAKMPMFKLETIVWGSNDQHDFCRIRTHLDKISYQDEGKTMIGEIYTSDPQAYMIIYDLKASILADNIISMQLAMYDRFSPLFVVPDVVDETVRKTFKTSKGIRESGFGVSKLNTSFYFYMTDPHDNHDFIFTTKNFPLVYVRNFIHLKFMVNSRHIFGLGERLGKFELADGLYSLWNKDTMEEETGLPPGHNLYGSHPFYLMHMHDPRLFAGVFFLNSNPMDVKIRHVGMQTQIDHLFSGGIIDAFFFQKGPVESVLKAYHYVIGNPIPLPYWAFGYHQSRWGYKDLDHLKDMVRKFENNMIPLDGVWMDKDYMKDMKIFTINDKQWGGLSSFVKELHTKNKHFVVLVDPGIAIDPAYPVYQKGLNLNLYITSTKGGPPLKGVTWPGYSVWIDFLHPSATKFWEDCLQEFYNQIPFDGLWLDMNEPSNFCDGECPDEIHYTYYTFPLDFYDDLYYNPTHVALESSTISMEAYHYGSSVHSTEFNYHNLYAFHQSKSTARFFIDNLHKRPFVISSGTFPGIGRYASHWLGDNWASWHYLEYSIAGVFNFQLFGIPFVGADICGFAGNTTVNLCSRWMQLGAFYPFMRNHNGPDHAPHEPFTDPLLMEVSKKAIRARYSLARYIYSEYMHTARYGGSIFKPILFEFPEDPQAYSILDITLMFGNAIRFTPVLDNGVSTLESYFPNWDWFDLNTLNKVVTYNRTAKTGKNLTLVCPLESGSLNIHIKAGTIFVYQPEAAQDISVTTISKMQNYSVELLIVPDHNGTAKGNVYYDDEHPKNYLTDHHDFSLEMNQNLLTVKLASGKLDYQYPGEDERISIVIILNAAAYKETRCAKFYDLKEARYVSLEISYDQPKEILRLNPKENKMYLSRLGKIIWSNDSNC